MPWSSTRGAGTHAKYRTAEHRRERAARMAAYERAGYVECAQPVCVMPTRALFWPEPAHLLHDEAGTRYLGLGHPECNIHDAAVRANRRSRGLDVPSRWAL